MRPPPHIKLALQYPVTAATGGLALVATLAWWLGMDISRLVMEGDALNRGQVWRFVTSALLHVNLIHLAFNLYWLWAFGTLVESTFGPLRTAALYVFLAAVSAAAEFAVFEGGVGLSGVGYGLFGMLWVLSRRDRRFVGAVDENVVMLFVAWFFICIVTTYLGVMQIANVAHGAGAIFGALVGAAVASRGVMRVSIGGATAALAVACIIGATLARPHVNFSVVPGEEEAYLGYVALRDGRNDEAVRLLREAVRLNPTDAASWYNLGIAYDGVGRAEDSANAFRRALELEPHNLDYRDTVEWLDAPTTQAERATTQEGEEFETRRPESADN